MVSAPRLRGRPLPSSDPTPGLARRAYGRVDAAPGCRIGDVSTHSPAARTPGPLPQADSAGRRVGCGALGERLRGDFPRRGSPGIPFARLKRSPPWLPLFEPGGGHCLAGTGSAADGRASGESDSAAGGGRAGGCSRVRARARRRRFSGRRGH